MKPNDFVNAFGEQITPSYSVSGESVFGVTDERRIKSLFTLEVTNDHRYIVRFTGKEILTSPNDFSVGMAMKRSEEVSPGSHYSDAPVVGYLTFSYRNVASVEIPATRLFGKAYRTALQSLIDEIKELKLLAARLGWDRFVYINDGYGRIARDSKYGEFTFQAMELRMVNTNEIDGKCEEYLEAIGMRYGPGTEPVWKEQMRPVWPEKEITKAEAISMMRESKVSEEIIQNFFYLHSINPRDLNRKVDAFESQKQKLTEEWAKLYGLIQESVGHPVPKAK
jgi:hypothetical protein